MFEGILNLLGLTTMSSYNHMLDADIDEINRLDGRLSDAKVMLRARCSEMPDCSRKTLLLKEIDAL